MDDSISDPGLDSGHPFEDPGGGRKAPETTTLSTIAVRSGATKIVIALLQSRQQLELKVLEVEPSLTLLGNTLPEASHLLDTQNEVIRQIESKHSPVDELVRKAKSPISSPAQRPIRPEVYGAMTKSLGVAWRDVNLYLTRRRDILERNVDFHSEADKCYSAMDQLETVCSGALPPDHASLLDLKSRVRDLRRTMLESLMAALNQGKCLLDMLREVARDGSPESVRVSALSAISQVEHWLENLHDKRRTLDLICQSRQIKLSKYRTIIELREELGQLEYQVEEISRLIQIEEFNSGSDVTSAQTLYRQNEQYLITAKEVQEKLIHFLKSAEDTPDLRKRAYLLLQKCADLIHETETRADLWVKVIHFFSSSHNVIEKLKSLQRDNAYNEEVKDWTPLLDEICGSVVLEGETLGIPIQNSEGIRIILQTIHQLRSSINLAWTRHQDSLIVRKLSSPCPPQDPILARKYSHPDEISRKYSHTEQVYRKYATLPSSMSRSQEYDRDLRVIEFQRSLTPQLTPNHNEFQPIHPHHDTMSRSFDLGYSSFDSRHDWSAGRNGPETPRRNGSLSNGFKRVSEERSYRLSPARGLRLHNGLEPISNGFPSDSLSRLGHSRGRLSSSQEAIQEIHRAMSPSVEDFENYVRNTYSQSVPPSPSYERECRFSLDTELRKQMTVETELRKHIIVETEVRENNVLARETQKRLEMIRENEILRKQEIEKIRNLERLKQIELRKLEQLKKQRQYEEELLKIKNQSEEKDIGDTRFLQVERDETISQTRTSVTSVTENGQYHELEQDGKISFDKEKEDKKRQQFEREEKTIEVRRQKLRQSVMEKQIEREEKLKAEMQYEAEKELERKKEKVRLEELEKLEREKEIEHLKLEAVRREKEEEERERYRKEKEQFEQEIQRVKEEEREKKRKEDLVKLRELEQELKRKHELEIQREAEEQNRLQRERLKKELEEKLEREREFQEQLRQEEIKKRKEIEERERALEQQRALDRVLEEEKIKRLKEMEKKLEEERIRKQRETEEEMEIERKRKEQEIQDRLEKERILKEREAEEKIQQEKIRKQKEMEEKLEQERRHKEKEIEDKLRLERIRKERQAEEELESERRRKQRELDDTLEEERKHRLKRTEELLERERRQREKDLEEQLEQERIRKQREADEKIEQERRQREKELQERLKRERIRREEDEKREAERKRKMVELEEQLKKERDDQRRRALEEERKQQEELERIKQERKLLEQERKRNEELLQKQKEELRKEKEQELRKQIDELKAIEREKERQRLHDLEVISQLEEERKKQKLEEEDKQRKVERSLQSPTTKTFVSRIPTPESPTNKTFVSRIPRPESPSSPIKPQGQLPQDKLNKQSLAEVNSARLYTTKPLKRFLECYQHVLTWLTTDVETFVNGHQDMGSGLALARQFFESHVQYLQDLEERKADISDIIANIPTNIRPDVRSDLDRKLTTLNEKYLALSNTISTRLKLSKHYVSIHELAVNLSIEYDLLDLLLSKRQQQDVLIDDKLAKLTKMNALFRTVCDRFFKLVDKIRDSDSQLDIDRTRACIDKLLEHFDNRSLSVDSKYHSYQIDISRQQDTKIRLMQNMADSTKTVDWVSKLDAQLYPILSEDLSSSQDVLNHIGDKTRVVLPEIRRALAEIKLRIKTAEDLLGQGQGEGLENLGEGVPPRLKELDEKLSNIVTDYQTMLEVYQTFFQNFLQLEKTIADMTAEVSWTGQDPANVPDMESMMDAHEMSKQTARELFKYVHAESIQVVNRIKELEPDQGADKDISIVNRILNSRRKQLDHLYTHQAVDLESKKTRVQFEADLSSIKDNIDELSGQLKKIQDGQGENGGSQSADSGRLSLHYAEKTIQLLAERIETFIASADTILKLESDTSHVETEMSRLKFKWNDLQNLLNDTRSLVDTGAENGVKVNEVSDFVKRNRQYLSTVTMKSHLVKSPSDAQELLGEIQAFLTPREAELKSKLQKLASQNNDADSEDTSTYLKLKTEAAELSSHFSSLKSDLSELANQKAPSETPQSELGNEVPSSGEKTNELESANEEKLSDKTNSSKEHIIPIHRELATPVHIEEIESIRGPTPVAVDFVPTAAAPVFVEPLRNSVVEEGAKFTFKCKVTGFPTPEISWQKDGLSIENNPDYQTIYYDGLCSLTIDETFAEDSAKFVCIARNSSGSAETSAFLSITGTDKCSATLELDQPLATPTPQFSVPLPQEAMVRAGQKLKLQCEVLNLDSPDASHVTWSCDGKPVADNGHDVKTYVEDNSLTLLISEAFPKHAGTYTLTIATPLTSLTTSCLVSVKGLLPNEISDTEAAPADVEPVKPSVATPLKDVALFEGAQVLLDCVIVGAPEPEVIWYHNGRPVKESEDFQLLFKGDKCSLLIKEVFVEDGGEYNVVAINSAGEASSSCKLTVQAISQLNEPVATRQGKVTSGEEEYTLPKFSLLLVDTMVREGDDVTLESCVEGNPKPTVKWTLNNKDIVYDDRVKNDYNVDTGKATLSISRATQVDKGLYTVRAENSLGEAKCFSHVIVKSDVNSVTAAANEEPQVHLSDIFEEPEFIEIFSDASVLEETPVKFECIAEGKPTPKIKWYFNDESISGKDFLLSTSGARQVCSIPEAHIQLSGGRISCVAENEAGRAVCSAQLLVTRSSTESLLPILEPTMSVAQLDAGPGTKSYEMKRSAMFSSQSSFGSRVNGAAAPGSEVTSYSSEKRESSQQIGSEPVIHSESETIKEYKNINGVESRNEKTTESSSSNFSEIVNKHEMLCSGGSHGSIPGLAKSLSNSSISKSSIRKTIAPRFISPLNGKIVDLGADVVLEAIIEGFPTPEVKWSKNGLPISSIPGKLNISFEHNKTRLELKNAGTEDGGRYTVTVENASGSAGCTADLIVKKSIFPPVMCRRLLPQSIYVGDRLVMEVEIAGTPTPTVQFYKDNQPISNYSQEYRLRQQGNSYAVIVEKANTSNSGTYKVTATNEGGEAISTADVRVSDKMAISTVPLPSFNQDLSFPPSSLQTDSKLQQRDFSNSSNFYKQQQQQTQSAYSTQENLSVSKTLVKEDKNSNLKVSNDFMPLNMPYSIQSSSSETHKETIIPVQPDNKTYIENHRTESTTSTQVVNSDQVDSDGIEHKPIPKKCALDFFKNIIKENENEQNFLKETEKPLPPSFYIDKKKEVHHHVENQEYQPSSFPHTDSEIPSEFSRSTFSETKTNTWKPVSPVPQPYTDTPLYLEPGPPPEMCFAPPVKPKETFTEKIKKIEETHKESYTSEVPRVIPDRNPIVEEQCTRTELYKKVTSPPIYQPEYNGHGPVLRPQADIHVRPTSPRPSAEGVSMEKLWTTKLHKESEIVRPASPLARPPSPKVISEIRESSHSEVRRCTSPRPSAEGVKMDKMWAHASNTSSTRTPHPTSLMPEIPVPVPDQKDVEDEEAKRLAWSRKYLQEEESSSLRTVRSSSTPAPAPTPTPVYKPPTPAPVYKPPTPVSAPVYKPPTPAPVYNPPKQPPTPTSQFPPKPVYAAPLLPPYTAPRELPKQQSFDESSFYKQQSSYQTNQKVNPPWVKTEAPQNIVTPPWVKQSPPPTPSQSYTQNFSSSEDRYSSSTQQKPAHFNNYSQPSAYQPFKPKPAASQQYRTESQESQIKQYSTPSFSPYSNQNSNQSNSSVVQQSYSSQTVQESYQSGSNQFSNSQQIPGSFSESSVVEEQHLKPSLANKVWPLVQSSNTNSNYSPVAPPFSSEPVTESTYSHEVIKTDNGYIEKEIKTQKSVQHEEKKFSYPPQCRSALQSKIAAFEEKNYHSDYDSRFDSSDSEMRRRSGSLKRLDRPSSVTGYKTLPKTYGRSNTYNMEYQTRSFSNSDVIPGLKPGSPPQILHASQLYKKGQTQGDSGYMADTEETFQSKISQEGPNVLGSTTKKEKSMFIAPQSQLTSSLQKSSRESYSKATRKHCPPARNPSKFVKGEFRESDYESDYEGKIRPKWRPYDSDNEEVTFRPVRPSTSEPKRRSFHASQAVPFPFEHETPPVVTDLRPYNPHTQHSGVKTSAFARNTQAQVMRKDFVCPPPPKFDYHSVQNFEPKVFEDTQSMSQSESGENFHRSMNVQQTTRVMTSGGVGVVDADAENRRLQRVEEMKRRFEEKSMIEAKQNSGGDLFSTPHIPSIGSAFSNNSSSVQQLNQSYQTTTSSSSCSSEQFYNSAQHQLTNGTSASHNFGVQNPTPQKVITLPDNFQSYLPEQFRRLPIFITPLRDIAVLSGGVARLECIVQADPTPSITWTKDGQVLHPSHQYNIEFRNGVCRLTLPHAYPFDAGSYSCTAVNAVGTCETSAALTVAGEKRSFHL